MPYVDRLDQDEGDEHNRTRVCKSCGARKLITEFHWAGKKTCRRRLCKTCQHEQQREAKARNPSVYKARAREAHLRKSYGMGHVDYLLLRGEQAGLCPICRGPLPDPAHIDHCHETGRVRGLLCLKCNIGIGSFDDRVEVLIWAAAYLSKHKRTAA